MIKWILLGTALLACVGCTLPGGNTSTKIRPGITFRVSNGEAPSTAKSLSRSVAASLLGIQNDNVDLATGQLNLDAGYEGWVDTGEAYTPPHFVICSEHGLNLLTSQNGNNTPLKFDVPSSNLYPNLYKPIDFGAPFSSTRETFIPGRYTTIYWDIYSEVKIREDNGFAELSMVSAPVGAPTYYGGHQSTDIDPTQVKWFGGMGEGIVYPEGYFTVQELIPAISRPDTLNNQFYPQLCFMFMGKPGTPYGPSEGFEESFADSIPYGQSWSKAEWAGFSISAEQSAIVTMYVDLRDIIHRYVNETTGETRWFFVKGWLSAFKVDVIINEEAPPVATDPNTGMVNTPTNLLSNGSFENTKSIPDPTFIVDPLHPEIVVPLVTVPDESPWTMIGTTIEKVGTTHYAYLGTQGSKVSQYITLEAGKKYSVLYNSKSVGTASLRVFGVAGALLRERPMNASSQYLEYALSFTADGAITIELEATSTAPVYLDDLRLISF